MNQFLGAIVLTVCIVFTFFFAVRYSVVHKYQVEATIDFDEKTMVAYFTDNPDKEDKHFPFMISAKVQESSNDIVVFDIVAYAPDDGHQYVLTVIPERSDFTSGDPVLEPGVNAKRVSVFFDPNSSFKRGVETKYMNFFIQANTPGKVDKTYVRKANYEKSWRKIRTKGIFLHKSDYHTQ